MAQVSEVAGCHRTRRSKAQSRATRRQAMVALPSALPYELAEPQPPLATEGWCGGSPSILGDRAGIVLARAGEPISLNLPVQLPEGNGSHDRRVSRMDTEEERV